MEEILPDLRSYIARLVAEGFAPRNEIVERAKEYAQDNYQQDDLGPHIERITAELIEKHLRAERSWPVTTDCDRLDHAFRALEQRGIVARQNFSCCCNCGHVEIRYEVEEASEVCPVEGYVFYHMQDTERASEGGDLFLAYGAVEEGDDKFVAVGRSIVQALESAGLRTAWNESPDERICVVDIDWKRRRND
jgi:hypothetical protein